MNLHMKSLHLRPEKEACKMVEASCAVRDLEDCAAPRKLLLAIFRAVSLGQGLRRVC